MEAAGVKVYLTGNHPQQTGAAMCIYINQPSYQSERNRNEDT